MSSALKTPQKSRLTDGPRRSPSRSSVAKAASSKPTPEKGPPRLTRNAPVASPSVREAIALRKAEAKKAREADAVRVAEGNAESLEYASPDPPPAKEPEDLLGRLPVRETIERARSTGALNLATRSLPCLPSALFEIHLGITPDPLKSVPNEPVLPPSEAARTTTRRGGRPAWFEAQDLLVLKAWSNEIVEIQHEISLFGSLKVLDLHNNKIASLPASLADLTALTTLDLSHNLLVSLPENIFALPELTVLNISNNALTTLPFNALFSTPMSISKHYNTSHFFAPAIVRATTPLPRLLNLDASNNKITSDGIDLPLPTSLTKIDLSENPLGSIQSLLKAVGSLTKLSELRMHKSTIADESFIPNLFSSSPFPELRLLDVSETEATLEAVKGALQAMKQELNFDFTNVDPPAGVARVLVGKKQFKEAWEIELEKRTRTRTEPNDEPGINWGEPAPAPDHAERPKETAGGKETSEVAKEDWELEAEKGLLTEGGKRRARAAATEQSPNPAFVNNGAGSSSSLFNPQYYTESTQTLKLPPSNPPAKSAHFRSFSFAASPSSSLQPTKSNVLDVVVPSPALPLASMAGYPQCQVLKVLILVNRRLDPSFSLPTTTCGPEGFLPNLEELILQGCNLPDRISIYSDATADAPTPSITSEDILPLITRLFPSLQTLDMTYNNITNASLTTDALAKLIFASDHRRGLRQLRLRGNQISELDGFKGIAECFKGGNVRPGWKLEELDLRDNAIGKLPPELGLLPLDVFHVDGNTFRVPQRRIWEREGTRGLLNWLKARIE